MPDDVKLPQGECAVPRIDRSASILPPYGMWRVAITVVLVVVATTQAAVSEGGYIPDSWNYDKKPQQNQDYDLESIYRDAFVRGQDPQRVLSDIVRELDVARQAETEPVELDDDLEIDLHDPRLDERLIEQLEADAPQDEIPAAAGAAQAQKADDPFELSEQAMNKLPKEAPAAPVADKEQLPEKNELPEQKQPMSAQKKGQSEFVSFVEPVDAKLTKSVQTVDKRRLLTSAELSSRAPGYSSNLLVIAVGTVMCVGVVASVVGGGMYLKRRRETPDDSEYAPYAGTGPGFKKGKKGDKGDETLAYKAQLHHYQQAKQKIICGDDAPGMVESEGEDDGADDENNFSVYECPGLAPTGDIEVVNPNFSQKP